MPGRWASHEAAGGLVRVWLPAGESLERHEGGLAFWSPAPEHGYFSVAAAAGPDDGDALLAAEREHGSEVEIERDERLERGGLAVRRLRYRSRRRAPREVVARGGVRTDVGGRDVETLADFLLFHTGGRLVRVGYAFDDGAPPGLADALADVLERVQIGDE